MPELHKLPNRSVMGQTDSLSGMLARSNSPDLRDGACQQIPLEVRHKFFDIDAGRDIVRLKAAKNICARCVVAPECLEDALHGPELPRGVRAGVSAGEISAARAWRRYELGLRDTPPSRPRPAWLSRPEAAEMAEATLVYDELGLDD